MVHCAAHGAAVTLAAWSARPRTPVSAPRTPPDAAAFVELMRAAKERSGLTYRELEARAAAHGDVLARSTLANALARNALPRADLVAAFVRACEGEERVPAWLAARDRLALLTVLAPTGQDAAAGNGRPAGDGAPVAPRATGAPPTRPAPPSAGCGVSAGSRRCGGVSPGPGDCRSAPPPDLPCCSSPASACTS
ncbi:hypothetical protein GCM10020256_36290 [Streptomyces thermocoprophilus]